jgi:hypothetical protein
MPTCAPILPWFSALPDARFSSAEQPRSQGQLLAAGVTAHFLEHGIGAHVLASAYCEGKSLPPATKSVIFN